MDFGWYGEADVSAGVSYLAGRSDVDEGRIAVVGLSMGGEEAIGAAAARRIRAVVAEGATNRAFADRDSWQTHTACGDGYNNASTGCCSGSPTC